MVAAALSAMELESGAAIAGEPQPSAYGVILRNVEPSPVAGCPVLPLQLRTVGQLLDVGFEVIRFRVRTIAIVTVAIGLPLLVVPQVVLALFGATQNPFEIFTGSGIDPTAVNPVSDGYFITMVLSYASIFLAAIAPMLVGVCVSRLIGGWLVEVDQSPAELFRFLKSRLITTSGSFLLATLIKVFGIACTCYLGAFYFIPVLSLLAPVVANEGLGAGQSISRCFALGKRRWGPLLGLSICWAISSGLAALFLSGSASAISALVTENSSVAFDVYSIATSIVGLALLGVQTCVASVAYLDVRVRTEGLDLDIDLAKVFS